MRILILLIGNPDEDGMTKLYNEVLPILQTYFITFISPVLNVTTRLKTTKHFLHRIISPPLVLDWIGLFPQTSPDIVYGSKYTRDSKNCVGFPLFSIETDFREPRHTLF